MHPLIELPPRAEILIKAPIAEEHPLLIFRRLAGQRTIAERLSMKALFEHGRALEHEELPEALWALLEEYVRFARLRNIIVHFAVPDVAHSDEVLKFYARIVESITLDFWNCPALEQASDWDHEIIEEGYEQEQLARMGITLPHDMVGRTRTD